MIRITLAATAAGLIATTTPLLAMSATTQSENLKLAQVQAPSVQVGPGGVTVDTKPKEKCRTVTTTVETPDGRKTTKNERRCEGE
jgi:hypothetical protein